MPKRRRLGDLYVTGKPVRVDDGKGVVEVWMQKLNPVENDDALRKAAAARAHILSYIGDEDSDEWKGAHADVRDFASRDNLVGVAIRDDLRNRRARIEAETADAEEWKKDDYLQGLVDLWEGAPDDDEKTQHSDLARPFKVRFDEDPEDPEAKRVHDELERFDVAVQALVDAEEVSLRADFEGVSDEELRRIATNKVLEQRSSQKFLDEYEDWQLYWGTRLPEQHSQLYFFNIGEVKGLQDEVRAELVGQYRLLVVDMTEGKGSEGTQGSSPSSDQSEPEETEVSSGLVDAAV